MGKLAAEFSDRTGTVFDLGRSPQRAHKRKWPARAQINSGGSDERSRMNSGALANKRWRQRGRRNDRFVSAQTLLSRGDSVTANRRDTTGNTDELLVTRSITYCVPLLIPVPTSLASSRPSSSRLCRPAIRLRAVLPMPWQFLFTNSPATRTIDR